MSSRRSSLAVMTITILTAGCALGDSTSGALVTRVDEPAAEMDALVGGLLSVDGTCFLLSGNPVVWPTDTSVSDDGTSIELPSGVTISHGDTVRGGGGQLPIGSIRETSLELEGDLDAARGCAPSATEIVVFTASGEGMTVS